ncbi:hypothetical protein KKA50_00735 [Patescibacteria group bacterium]|nr:hypothetical protein [Patescibacteria group bacterium]
MANKKSKTINTAPKEVKQIIKKEKSMVAKVEVKAPRDSEKVSQIVGAIFIFLGVLLVAFGVYSFIKYSATPQLNETLVSPSVSDIPSITNNSTVTVSGNANGYDTVYVYVNGEKNQTVKVGNKGDFSTEVTLNDEGKYEITVAGVKGFPKRYLSAQSLAEVITLDKQAPVLEEINYSKEVGTETFTVTGTVEEDAQVIVKRGTDYYSATCDAQGYFKIVSIALDQGANVFNMVIKDTAGNETVLDGEIKVTYSPDSSVNGDAVTDDSLPVAAGEFSRMADYLLGDNLVLVFGILALLSGVTTTSVLYLKSKRE